MATYLEILHNCETALLDPILKDPWVANGPQNSFTGPRRLLWLFDNTLKPNSLYLFDDKQIGGTVANFCSQSGPSTPFLDPISAIYGRTPC